MMNSYRLSVRAFSFVSLVLAAVALAPACGGATASRGTPIDGGSSSGSSGGSSGAIGSSSGGSGSTSSGGSPGEVDSSTPDDGSFDVVIIHHPEASPSQDSGPSVSEWDGTSGKPCMTDTDCYGVGGPHINKCTSDALFQEGEIDPTPICLDPVPCDPCGGTNPCDSNFHQCDGPDNSAASPGICIPTTAPEQAGMGACQAACTFVGDGSAPTGCVGKDVCNPFGFNSHSGIVSGVGICQGGCTADSDCTGEKCDVLRGLCVTTVPTRTKNVGEACSGSTDNSCYCPWASAGACTAFCRAPAAGTPDPCGAGFACVTFEPTTIAGTTTDASMPGFALQNQGMAGFCLPKCAAVDAAGCPVGWTCQDGFPVGSAVCAPPP
jgi:hypothetical protein